MTLIPGSQRVSILRSMIAFPEATIKETQIMVQNAGHDKCAPHHIKNLMQSEGIKRVRVRGNLYRYKVPQSLINNLAALDSGVHVVNKSKVDRVWTPEMKVCEISRVLEREANRLRYVA